MQQLKVEKPYHAGLKRIPEGFTFFFNQGGGFLQIVFDSPLDSEIKEIKDGEIKLGLIEEKGIIFLLFKFGHLPWMDTPYNVALSQPYELQEITDEKTGYTVQVVLIDGMTGIVKALKLIELPHEMSKRFKELVENQRKAPTPDYEAILNQLYSTYDTIDFLTEADTYTL
jgi:hypothetical protein